MGKVTCTTVKHRISVNGSKASCIFIWNKVNQVLYHTTPKINSQWIVDLLVKGKTITILGDTIGKYLCDLRI